MTAKLPQRGKSISLAILVASRPSTAPVVYDAKMSTRFKPPLEGKFRGMFGFKSGFTGNPVAPCRANPLVCSRSTGGFASVSG